MRSRYGLLVLCGCVLLASVVFALSTTSCDRLSVDLDGTITGTFVVPVEQELAIAVNGFDKTLKVAGEVVSITIEKDTLPSGNILFTVENKPVGLPLTDSGGDEMFLTGVRAVFDGWKPIQVDAVVLSIKELSSPFETDSVSYSKEEVLITVDNIQY